MSSEYRRDVSGVYDLGGFRVMIGLKQGDSGQRSKPVGLVN